MKSQHYDPRRFPTCNPSPIYSGHESHQRLGTAGRALSSQLIIVFGFLIFGLTHFSFASTLRAAGFVATRPTSRWPARCLARFP